LTKEAPAAPHATLIARRDGATTAAGVSVSAAGIPASAVWSGLAGF